MKFYYVYILLCIDNSYYVGMTSALDERVRQHNSGFFPEAYTFQRRPVELKWFEKFTDASQAMDREKQLKGWSKKKKEALILNDWDKMVNISKNYTQFGKPD